MIKFPQMIKILNQLPENILNLEANQLHQCVDNHTILKLEGKIQRPLFISILQHGDETTGWDALKVFLKNHLDRLPRSLCIYFGNIEAAAQNLRQLDGQVDFNRCWPGRHNRQDDTVKIMAEVTETVKALNPFASVDIHNNSGRNPHYSGINSLNGDFVNLASLFADTMIHFTSPDGIQSGAFAAFCPSVTIECGQSGTADGIEQTVTFLENLIHLPNLHQVPGIAEHRDVMNIFATVKIKPKHPFAVGQHKDNAQFVIPHDLDAHNFHMLEPGVSFGQLHKNPDLQAPSMPFMVSDQLGHDITDQYFEIAGDQVVLKHAVMPAMITQSERAIKLDCLCYLMRPLATNKYKTEHQPEQLLRETS